MPSELTLLTRLISGDLSPTAFNLTGPIIHRDFLCQRFGMYVRHYKIQYTDSPSGEFIYQCHDEFLFLELDGLPRLPPSSATTATATAARTLSLLLADTLPRFNLTFSQVQEVGSYQADGLFFLEITASCSFDCLQADKARYFYYHTQLLDEAARLRQVLPDCALQQSDATAITRYVQQHQHTLQRLLSHAQRQVEYAGSARGSSSPREYSLAEVHQLLYEELEKLLAYFEHTFPEHLNLTAPLSYRRRLLALADLQKPLATVLAALRDAENLPARLVTPLADCLNRLLINVQDTGLSYQDVLYPRLLLNELYCRIQRHWSFTVPALACLMMRYNFNSQPFLNFITAHLRAEADAAGPLATDRIPVVQLQLKRYRQLQSATEIRYVPTLPPFQTQLINWLKEEHNYLKHQKQAEAPAAVNSSAIRIQVPLSVAQMAHLLRMLYEAGVFGQANQRDLFRLLATNFRTARQEQISEKSLADKYYNAEDSTRQAVEKLVAKMLENIRP